MKKHTCAFLLSVVLVVSIIVSGCSDNKPSAANTTGGAKGGNDEKVELTLWATPTGLGKDGQKAGEWISQDLVAEFNKIYPNVKINVELIPFDGIQEKISVAAASKTLPNIYFDVPNRILPLSQLGVIEPLDDILSPKDLEAVRSNPDMMKLVSLNNQIIIMPLAATPVTILVNKSMWAKANALDLLPKDEFRTWTLDEFKAALKAVADPKNNTYGFTMYALNEQGDELYNNTLMTHGVKLFNDNYSKYLAAENPKTEQVMTFFKSLVDEGLVNPHPETLSTTNANDFFYQGKNGMVVASPAVVQNIKAKIKDGSIKEPFDYMFVNFPSEVKGTSGIKLALGNGTIFKDQDPNKVKWAKIFFKWAINDTEMFFNAQKIMKSVGDAPAWTKEDKEWGFLTTLLTKSGQWPLIDPLTKVKGFTEMRAAMYPEMQRMFINAATPKQTVDNISKKFNDITQKYNK